MMHSHYSRDQTPAVATLHSTGEAAFAVNAKGEIILWNQAAESAFGYPASRAEGQRCWNLLCGRDAYHNEYCGRECQLRSMVIRGKPVYSSMIFFRSAAQDFTAYRVTTLLLSNGPGEQLIAQICRPEAEVATHTATQPARVSGLRPSNNGKRGALTHREREVLELIAEGKSTREIASLMCVSVYTVRNHVGHILSKLHVRSRLESVAVGRKLQLIPN
jgi:DNA-binding CsgD family transcriptional regulator